MSLHPEPASERPDRRSGREPGWSPRADLAAEARIEAYLDRLCAPLLAHVSLTKCRELRAEWAAHLESLAAAYEELGSEPRQAEEQALAQFGDPEVVAAAWLREWRPDGKRRTLSDHGRSLLTSLICFGSASALAIAFFLLAHGNTDSDFLWEGLLPVTGFLLPAIAGMLTGLLAPTTRSSWVAHAVIALLTLQRTIALPFLHQPITLNSEALVVCWLAGIFWMPVGGIAMSLGSRLRAQCEEEPRALKA